MDFTGDTDSYYKVENGEPFIKGLKRGEKIAALTCYSVLHFVDPGQLIVYPCDTLATYCYFKQYKSKMKNKKTGHHGLQLEYVNELRREGGQMGEVHYFDKLKNRYVSFNYSRQVSKHRVIEAKAGSTLVFRQDLPHCGAPYKKASLRLFFYVDKKGLNRKNNSTMPLYISPRRQKKKVWASFLSHQHALFTFFCLKDLAIFYSFLSIQHFFFLP